MDCLFYEDGTFPKEHAIHEPIAHLEGKIRAYPANSFHELFVTVTAIFHVLLDCVTEYVNITPVKRSSLELLEIL